MEAKLTRALRDENQLRQPECSAQIQTAARDTPAGKTLQRIGAGEEAIDDLPRALARKTPAQQSAGARDIRSSHGSAFIARVCIVGKVKRGVYLFPGRRKVHIGASNVRAWMQCVSPRGGRNGDDIIQWKTGRIIMPIGIIG